MPLNFRIPSRDESAARSQAAELRAASLEPVRVTTDGSDVLVEVRHPLALLLSGVANLLCCGCGRLSRIVCPEQDYKPHGTQGA